MDYTKAYQIAKEIEKALSPNCSVINIAGSIRRQKKEVGDIEIVCLPLMEESKDLFGNKEFDFVSPAFQMEVTNLGDIIKGKTDGRYIQIALHGKNIQLDLFMPQPHDYYRQFTIRTGSADFVFRNIASGWKRIGWCGTEDGLRLMSECTETDLGNGKSKWKCSTVNPTLPPIWKSEQEFFEWVQVEHIKPEYRV